MVIDKNLYRGEKKKYPVFINNRIQKVFIRYFNNNRYKYRYAAIIDCRKYERTRKKLSCFFILFLNSFYKRV